LAKKVVEIAMWRGRRGGFKIYKGEKVKNFLEPIF